MNIQQWKDVNFLVLAPINSVLSVNKQKKVLMDSDRCIIKCIKYYKCANVFGIILK